MRMFLAFALVCFHMTSAFARDIYVNNVSGDDRRDGASIDLQGALGGPCRSIRRALQLAENGDRIVLAKNEEPYRESVTLQAERHSGLPNRPFILVGNGAVLDGTQPVPERSWEPAGGPNFRFRPSRLKHHLLYLDGKPALRRLIDRFAALPQLNPGEWCTYQNFVYFCAAENRLPRNYNLSLTALPVGVTLYEVRHVELRDLVVQGFQLDGINAHDGATSVTLSGLNCRGNGRSGISIGGASRVVINACLVGNNGTAQVRTEGSSRTEIVNSELLENTAPALVRDGGLVTMVPDNKTIR